MIIIYLIKSSLSLFIFYIFYHFFISKDRMHLHKRIYLLFALVFSLLIPLIKVNIIFFTSISIENTIPALREIPNKQTSISGEVTSGLIPSDNLIPFIIFTIYALVLILLLLRFSLNLYRLIKNEKNQIHVDYKGYKIVLLSDDIVPYSFLNRIYVNRKLWEEDKIDEALIKHEIYHIQKHHSLDLIFVEILQILLWFNPVIILYKRAIRLNHEHQVDQKVIEELGNIQHYQEMLLSAATKKFYKQFASGFDSSFIKSRLLMMTSRPSLFLYRIKMLIVVPFIILMTASLVISQDFSGDNILASPYFIKMAYPKINGNWIGNGGFLFNKKLNNEIGEMKIQINITDDLKVSGKIGDASFTDATIEIANYGLEIVGDLEGKIKRDYPLKKQHIIILMALPEIEKNTLDASFHLLNNLNWDKHMRVGKVILSKTD